MFKWAWAHRCILCPWNFRLLSIQNGSIDPRFGIFEMSEKNVIIMPNCRRKQLENEDKWQLDGKLNIVSNKKSSRQGQFRVDTPKRFFMRARDVLLSGDEKSSMRPRTINCINRIKTKSFAVKCHCEFVWTLTDSFLGRWSSVLWFAWCWELMVPSSCVCAHPSHESCAWTLSLSFTAWVYLQRVHFLCPLAV